MAKRILFASNGRNYYFRQPQIGNTDTIAFQRINRTTRGGDLIIFRDNEWPVTEVLGLTFDFDCETPAQQFLQFLKDTCGLEIDYTDHEGVLWRGIIQNPEADLKQVSIASWQISISFEGTQV